MMQVLSMPDPFKKCIYVEYSNITFEYMRLKIFSYDMLSLAYSYPSTH
jgi:hypothetical protein